MKNRKENTRWKLAKVGKRLVNLGTMMMIASSLSTIMIQSVGNLTFQNTTVHADSKVNSQTKSKQTDPKTKILSYKPSTTDTLSSIAKRFNVSRSYVRSLTGIKKSNVLFAGVKLSAQKKSFERLSAKDKKKFSKNFDYVLSGHKQYRYDRREHQANSASSSIKNSAANEQKSSAILSSVSTSVGSLVQCSSVAFQSMEPSESSVSSNFSYQLDNRIGDDQTTQQYSQATTSGDKTDQISSVAKPESNDSSKDSSASTAQSVAASHSASVAQSQAASLARSKADSIAASQSASIAQSVATSNSASVAQSQAASLAKSKADSVAASQSASTAQSIAASQSALTAQSIAASVAQSQAASAAKSKADSVAASQSASTAKSIAESQSASAASSAASSQASAAKSTADSIAASQSASTAQSIAASQSASTASSQAASQSASTAQSIAAIQSASTAKSIADSIADSIATSKANIAHDNVVSSTTVNKSRYNPNEVVQFNVNLQNMNASKSSQNKVDVKIYKDNNQVADVPASDDDSTVSAGSNKTLTIDWKAPGNDYQGYRAEINVDGQVQKVVAIDVSSDINKFPRYGSVTQFNPGTDNSQALEQMKNWDINSLEYYDAYQDPQTPINADDPTGDWKQNWAVWLSDADKTKSGQVIKNTVDQAHQYGMDSLFYNMIYAITGNASDPAYLKSIGVKPEWLLYHADGSDKNKLFQFPMAGYINDHSDPNYLKALQTYLDIKNPEVVDWIVSRMRPVLEDLNFDGWHGDTIGNNDLMYSKNADGSIKNEYHVSDELGNFANMVKERLNDKKFVVNTVSFGGEDNVAKSKADFDYSEQWDGNLYSLDQKIKYIHYLSGKSLVIPAYLQSDYASADNGANRGKDFNENSVLLLDSVVYAAGGSRMEVVDGQHLLVGAFFPSKDLVVTDALKAQIQNYQTFITAYENLLRDGQSDNNNTVHVYDNNGKDVTSNNTTPNKVYAYGRSSNDSETVQLINMLGMNSDNWKDEDNSRQAPNTLNNFHVSYYPSAKYRPDGSSTATHVYLASPDGDKSNQSVEVPFTWKKDNSGNYYMDITVPSLQRWDMLYLK